MTTATPAPALTAGLLRLATAGSVDDGKSTLVGRLLHDTRSILADQLAAIEHASRARGLDTADLALLTDGLRAEREQGITIDVAYRYFATARRSFILADTPGHVQYTRNMVTGASTAQAAIILVDARHGVLEQTRRHATIAALLGVPHLVLAVNKMDLVSYDQAVFSRITREFSTHCGRLGVRDLTAVPCSALRGDNVVDASPAMGWYRGPTLLAHLETLGVDDDPAGAPFRMPVQYVLRPQAAEYHDYRGYAGQITSGVIRLDDAVVVQPTGLRTQVAAIDGLDGPLVEAFAPMSVTLRVTDDLDIARGDLLADATAPARTTRDLDGVVCWLAERPLTAGARVLVRTGTRTVRARVDQLSYRLDVQTLTREPVTELRLNDLAGVRVRTAEPIAVDDYRSNRRTGAFLLIGHADGATLAAGMAGNPLTAGSDDLLDDPITGDPSDPDGA
jgi:sulfate adenylyltransferase subunit 1